VTERIIRGPDQRLSDHHARLAAEALEHADAARAEGNLAEAETWEREAAVRASDAERLRP
jgi:hypothetical protein